MELQTIYCKEFDCPEIGIRFKGGYLYCGNNNNNRFLLINNKGYIMMIGRDLQESLLQKNICPDFAVKLIQRNMAEFMDDAVNEKPVFDKLDDFPIRPEFFMIDLTNACNMQCIYCLRNYNQMTISDEMIDQICGFIIEYCKLEKLNAVSLQPWGGEPFLFYPKIIRILDNIEAAGIKSKMTIETNGTLLTRETVEQLYNRNVNISVSIDGYEELHNLQRPLRDKRNSFEEVKKGIFLLKQYYGDSLSVLATITRNTAPYIKEIISFFAENFGIKFMKINFVHRSGFIDNEELCLDEREIAECSVTILQTIVELNRRGIRVNEYNIWNKITNIVCRSRNDCCESRGCNGGKMMVAIDGSGSIYPCDLTDYPEEKIGHIADGDNLIHMVKNAQKSVDFFCEKVAEKCENCPWHFFCRGGCSVHVKTMNLPRGSIDPINCASNRVLYPEIIRLLIDEPEIIDRLIAGNR